MTVPFRRCLRLAAGAALAAAVAGPAAAQQDESSPVATYRTAVMEALRAHTGAMRAVVTAHAPFEYALQGHATAVHQLALQLSHVFPQGSGGEGTRAKDEIWQDTAEFAALVSAFQDAAAVLEGATLSGDMAAVGEALTPVTRSCAGCHRVFRKPEG